jgi:uncharacterized membrane protein HdeD (DUF308 family)
MTTITTTSAFDNAVKKARSEQRLQLGLGMTTAAIGTAVAAMAIVPSEFSPIAVAMLLAGLLQVAHAANNNLERRVTAIALPAGYCVASLFLIASGPASFPAGLLFIAIGTGRVLAANRASISHGWDWCAGSGAISLLVGASFFIGLPQDAPVVFSAALSIDLVCQALAILNRALKMKVPA